MADETGVTQLLRQISNGRREAIDELVPVVYEELRRLAQRQLRSERSDHTLSPTALVHEAYMKLVDLREVDWQDRAHFFAMSARQMRRILISYARARGSLKRGGNRQRVPLTDAFAGDGASPEDLVVLDDALTRLEAIDPRVCRVVECRTFAGLSVEETAHAIGASPTTVKRDWSFARAWLNRALSDGTADTPDG